MGEGWDVLKNQQLIIDASYGYNKIDMLMKKSIISSLLKLVKSVLILENGNIFAFTRKNTV